MLDFRNAANRHLRDAECLLLKSNLPNADQLFGLSAECALKAIMQALGMAMKNERPLSRNHGHINVLWDEFITFANGKNQSKYADALTSNNPFSSWHVSQRYEDGSAITQQIVDHHKKAAELAFSCLSQAETDGVVK